MAETENLKPIVLTIAGSDSSGGAGIQADLKALAATGVHGASVITTVTAQNTEGVIGLEPISSKMIASQLDAVLNDLKPTVIKTGMLYSSEIITMVVSKLYEYHSSMDNPNHFKLIVDPVLNATTGAGLIEKMDNSNDFFNCLKDQLIPISTVITPNLYEASQLLGWDVQTFEEMEKACVELKSLGSDYVLLKGGHLLRSHDNNVYSDTAVDILYNGQFTTYQAPREHKDVHGTGCTFASLIAGYMARGFQLTKAIEFAKSIISIGIVDSLVIGNGVETVNIHSRVNDDKDDDRYQLYIQVTSAAEELTKILKPSHIPEVGINIGYALPNTNSLQDVCALTGRIVRVGTKVGRLGCAEFGASKHIARIILAAMDKNKKIRSTMNFKYRPETIKKCKTLGFSIGTFDRTNEPESGSSMEWGTKIAIEALGFAPDLIYDVGGFGKEPMIRILGTSPEDVLEKLKRIIIVQD